MSSLSEVSRDKPAGGDFKKGISTLLRVLRDFDLEYEAY